ncbi:MAG: hypothetical protein KBE09_04505 [Candidatus Pacebacteria bacterium]|nr:hypothetical protein [Candidatus Paceibacterota bacterium]
MRLILRCIYYGVASLAVVVALHPLAVQAIDIPTALVISICGDSIINAGEVCDAGSFGNTGLYGSSTAERICNSECSGYGPYCGDGVLQVRFDEAFDDGNNTSGDLCTAQCIAETPVPPGGGGPASVGIVPSVNGGAAGSIPARVETKVVLRGKAYPNSSVNILLDGKKVGTVLADVHADFLFSTSDITPGTANFSFIAKDKDGNDSITTSMVFEVVQSAITTVANIFIPPTLVVNERRIKPGEPLTISGSTVPKSKVTTLLKAKDESKLNADADDTGSWALQVDTASLTEGFHTAKALFELSSTVKSGYGRSVNFFVGEGEPGILASADLNQDGKVNLVDFSIFLLSWGKKEGDSDFNGDGAVNLADFSIMLFNWTG